MNLRKLTESGIKEFAAYLTNLKVEPTLDAPSHLLSEPAASEALDEQVQIERVSFETRFHVASYLYERLSGLPQVEREAGLWAWLALFYFDELCPPGNGGVRKPGEQARYIPAIENFQRYYRHLLLGPFLIYQAHADDPQRVKGVLLTAPHAPGDIVEQLASRQELITNRAVMGTVTQLYVDPSTGRLKRGSGGKGGGSPRRLADILNQFDVTYDLYSMAPDQLSTMLPKEFDRFRN